MTRRSGTPTTPNASRGRKMITLTMGQDTIAELDRERGGMARGAFIEMMLSALKHIQQALRGGR